jgi:hypothetical protein
MAMRRVTMISTVLAIVMAAMAPTALAGNWATDQEQKEAAGWGCAGAVGLPPGHCINPATTAELLATGALPQTFQLLVFAEDGSFLTAEIATFKASADNRACPIDPESPDGTYWDFVAGVLYVCHHQPG